MHTPQFTICDGKGFQITFATGWTLSVQFGPGNYCDNFNMNTRFYRELPGRVTSENAEIAILNPQGELVDLGHGDQVAGYINVMDVLKYIPMIQLLAPDETEIPMSLLVGMPHMQEDEE